MLPKIVKYGPRRYKVITKEITAIDTEVCYGTVSHLEETIQIANKYPEWRQEETFIHELTHIIDDDLHLELTEEQIDGLARGLCILLRENRDLFNKKVKNTKV